MAKFVLLFVCLAVIHASQALKCKTCKDSKDLSCSVLEDQTCGASASGMEPACLVHIYKEGKDSKDEIVEKKCVSRTKGGKYECIPVNNRVEVKCTTCTDDFCNEKSAAWKPHLGVFTVVGLLVGYLVL